MIVEEIKREVIYSDSQTRLFEITIELTEEISKLHIELVNTKDETVKGEIKGKISLLHVFQNIIDRRIEDVRMGEVYHNRRFKIVAEAVLSRETLERIRSLSLLSHQEFKGQRTCLRANKLE